MASGAAYLIAGAAIVALAWVVAGLVRDLRRYHWHG